jgi:hypothetical protein
MSLTLAASFSAAGLFLGMLILFEVGRRIGIARQAHDPEGVSKGAGAVEGAVFGLLGLLLAFTFSGAASRFEDRRHLITREANAIGTAYLRLDVLPGDAQAEIRELFRRYLDTRSEIYRNKEDTTATKTKFAEAAVLQGEIWAKASSAVRRPEVPRRQLRFCSLH